MYYTAFRIRNFKGIKDTTIRLKDQSKVGVFSFVGLNESGKTTILEAIHSFSPDRATSDVVGGEGRSGVPVVDRVPRHLLSNFTGDVSVTASVQITIDERNEIIDWVLSDHQLIVDPDSIPSEIDIERHQQFKDGDFVAEALTLRCKPRVKTGKQKRWREPTASESIVIRDSIYSYTPDIAYFPTFVFDFPEQIFLTTGRGGRVNAFYRQVFQDVLDFDGQGLTIDDSLVRRVRSDEKKVPWPEFLNIWNASDDRDKLQHVMDRAGAAISEVVFGRWNRIFGEEVKGKEIAIVYELIEGERRDSRGVVSKTLDHDLCVKFQIRDGTRRFDINDRSLGFRWFFAFMLFTQFRVAREDSRPVLLLFDEPASNLHAAAQQKLIESFPEIAKGDHTLAYSTHSHYMIEPKWLEQTFIVTNRADAPSESVIDGLSLSDESLDIKATKYRQFVDRYPNQTSYFQPVLDRLQVVPSKFDIDHTSVLVEGKADYYVLVYASQMLKEARLPLLPAFGAGTFDVLISLHMGWGVGMVLLLDGDKAGMGEKKRYIDEYGLDPASVLTLGDVDSSMSKIESLLDDDAKKTIAGTLRLKSKPSKNQIRRYFQECLARNEAPPLGAEFERRAQSVLSKVRDTLATIG